MGTFAFLVILDLVASLASTPILTTDPLDEKNDLALGTLK